MSEKKIVGYCNNCGGPLYEGNKFCTQCGTTITGTKESSKVSINQTVTATPSAPVSTGSMETNLNGLVLSENEKPVRQYHVASTRRPKVDGFLTVTNKRMIFHADGKGLFTSRLTNEIKLDSVSGVDCYYGTNFKILVLIIGILIAVFGLNMLFGEYASTGTRIFGFIILLVGAWIIYSSYRKSFKLSVYAKDCNPSSIGLGEGMTTFRGNAVVMALVSGPTADTIRMLNELGALVNDLQAMGDKALDKWSQE